MAQAQALPWASAKLAGGTPVTLRMSSLGREPCPEAIIAASQDLVPAAGRFRPFAAA
jgi:hypothetical protein